jgi:hypothetical protein
MSTFWSEVGDIALTLLVILSLLLALENKRELRHLRTQIQHKNTKSRGEFSKAEPENAHGRD